MAETDMSLEENVMEGLYGDYGPRPEQKPSRPKRVEVWWATVLTFYARRAGRRIKSDD